MKKIAVPLVSVHCLKKKVFEGYESDPEREQGLKRRSSMEKIRKAHENGGLAVEQISASQFSEASLFLEDIVESIRSTKRRPSRSILPKFKRSKSRDVGEQGSSLREDSVISKCSRLSTKSEPGTRRRNMQKIDSKSVQDGNSDSSLCSFLCNLFAMRYALTAHV
uniref:Uncharacterized protein n=1 Tax=Heterorhabditis bacteriophora TaxID=37862 RepID=A0A1I7X617_HETBA